MPLRHTSHPDRLFMGGNAGHDLVPGILLQGSHAFFSGHFGYLGRISTRPQVPSATSCWNRIGACLQKLSLACKEQPSCVTTISLPLSSGLCHFGRQGAEPPLRMPPWRLAVKTSCSGKWIVFHVQVRAAGTLGWNTLVHCYCTDGLFRHFALLVALVTTSQVAQLG